MSGSDFKATQGTEQRLPVDQAGVERIARASAQPRADRSHARVEAQADWRIDRIGHRIDVARDQDGIALPEVALEVIRL